MSEPKEVPLSADRPVHVFPIYGGHVLEGADCWCLPTIIRASGSADIIVHNRFAAGVKPPKREC